MLGRTDSRGRALLLLLVFVLAAGSLVARLAYWQVVRHDDLSAMAREQTSFQYELPTRRAAIYDRTGTMLLATTVERARLVGNPRSLTAPVRARVAEVLVAELGLEGADATRLRERMASDKAYVVLARGLDTATADRIRALSRGRDATLAGLSLETEHVRYYPQEGGEPGTTLASHLLGFVNRDGAGQYGVEQYHQEALAGTPRLVMAQRDINGRAIPDSTIVLQPETRGQDLVLTIDGSLQVALEEELLATWIADGAKRVSAVILDPWTGEVYAEGSVPGYDANAYGTEARDNPGIFVDPVIASPYEPGSVMKMFTAAAALGGGTVELATKVNDTGTLRLDRGRTRIDDADHRKLGLLTFEDGIAQSRNVVSAKVALGLGATTSDAARVLHETWVRLGLDRPTGIDLTGEKTGTIRDPAVTTWRQIDLANASFGQGLSVTTLQMAQSYAAMVNGGYLVQPRVVRSVGGRATEPVVHGRVIGEQLSEELRGLMRHVISSVPMYRSRTAVPGAEVGGKTGTAQIWDSKAKRWKENLFNYSFVGYVGRDAGHPDLVIAVRIEEGKPTVVRRGQLEMPIMSFQLFQRLAMAALGTPDILPERTDGSTLANADR